MYIPLQVMYSDSLLSEVIYLLFTVKCFFDERVVDCKSTYMRPCQYESEHSYSSYAYDLCWYVYHSLFFSLVAI